MKEKVLWGVLVLAVVASVGIGAAAQNWGPTFGHRDGFDGGQRVLAMLDNSRVRAVLNLTDDQAAKLRQIVVSTEKTAIKTRADLAIDGIDLREMLLQDKPDRDAVIKKVDEISALRGDMAKGYVDALLQAKQVLTPEQQKKIRQFLEMRRMMRERGGHGMMGPEPRGGMRPNAPGRPQPPTPPPTN